jgi:hypothetical protein
MYSLIVISILSLASRPGQYLTGHDRPAAPHRHRLRPRRRLGRFGRLSLAPSLRHIEGDGDFAEDDSELLLLTHRQHREAEKLVAEVIFPAVDEFTVFQTKLNIFEEGLSRSASVTVVEKSIFDKDGTISVIHRLASHDSQSRWCSDFGLRSTCFQLPNTAVAPSAGSPVLHRHLSINLVLLSCQCGG